MEQQNNENDLLRDKKEKKVSIFRKGIVWRPVPTVLSTTLCFAIIGVIFLVIGIIIIVSPQRLKNLKLGMTTYQNVKTLLIITIKLVL